MNQFNKAKTSFGDQKIISNVSLSAFVLDLRAGPDDKVMTWNLWHLDFPSVRCKFFYSPRPILSKHYYRGESSTVSAQNSFESVIIQIILSVSLLLLTWKARDTLKTFSIIRLRHVAADNHMEWKNCTIGCAVITWPKWEVMPFPKDKFQTCISNAQRSSAICCLCLSFRLYEKNSYHYWLVY